MCVNSDGSLTIHQYLANKNSERTEEESKSGKSHGNRGDKDSAPKVTSEVVSTHCPYWETFLVRRGSARENSGMKAAGVRQGPRAGEQ